MVDNECTDDYVVLVGNECMEDYAVLVDNEENGRLAQLVERPLDVGKVRGSTPLSSTKQKPPCWAVFEFRFYLIAEIFISKYG